jgi:hypothetical protein
MKDKKGKGRGNEMKLPDDVVFSFHFLPGNITLALI